MAGLFNKIMRFAKSPEGRRAINQAKRYAKDPHTRKQAKDAFDRLRGKKGHGKSY
ncbi:hypothetical protein [Amycolatopsis suaedae]|uniref:hypothetical protein n=1 Tax=Amycolatopsis suaedae TaxID=2510978 RepID=UPI0013EF4917|nr:hypothetical protein [Amycolatopsis suaedae]